MFDTVRQDVFLHKLYMLNVSIKRVDQNHLQLTILPLLLIQTCRNRPAFGPVLVRLHINDISKLNDHHVQNYIYVDDNTVVVL